MKKSTLNLIILTALISSCGKTTKSKVINDWKVTSYVANYSNTNEYGDQTVGTLNIDETNYTLVEDASQGFDHTRTGKMAYYNYAIKKDGTWSSESEVTIDATPISISQKIAKKRSGTWSFIGKTKGDDYKKNERILFNILYDSEIVTDADEPNDPQAMTSTYLVGEKSSTYTVIESKGKKLELEQSQNNSLMFYQDIQTGTALVKIILEEK